MILLLLAAAAAPPSTPADVSARPVLQVAPRKDDSAACRQTPSSQVVVQGGIAATNPDLRAQARTGAVTTGLRHDDPRTIGPKHDDPAGGGRGAIALAPGQDDPRTIGPKHDDPSPPPPTVVCASPSGG